MTAYYRTPQEIENDVVTDIAPDLLRDVILPSNLLSSDECSDDYRRLYALRIEQEIASSSGDLRRALGEGRFAALVRNFLAAAVAAIDVSRASQSFAAFLRAEAERDPALWFARAVALRHRGTFRLRSGLARSRDAAVVAASA